MHFSKCGCKGTAFFGICKKNRRFFIKKRKFSWKVSCFGDIYVTLPSKSYIYIILMNQTSQLVETITKGIQEKKGQRIVVADLQGIESAISNYFIICQGNSPSQVEAITESVSDMARELLGEKPTTVVGLENAQWVAMDYGDVLVHIFVPDMREFYDLEHLWDDAELTQIPDLD